MATKEVVATSSKTLTVRIVDHGTDQIVVFDKFQIDAFLLESVQARFNEIYPYLLACCEYT